MFASIKQPPFVMWWFSTSSSPARSNEMMKQHNVVRVTSLSIARVYLLVLLMFSTYKYKHPHGNSSSHTITRTGGITAVDASTITPNFTTMINWGFCRDLHLSPDPFTQSDDIELQDIQEAINLFQSLPLNQERLLAKELLLNRNLSAYCGYIRDMHTRQTLGMIAFRGFDFRNVWIYAETFSRFLCVDTLQQQQSASSYCQLDTLQALTNFLVKEIQWVQDTGIDLITEEISTFLWNKPYSTNNRNSNSGSANDKRDGTITATREDHLCETFHPLILHYNPLTMLEGVWEFVYEILQRKAIEQGKKYQEALVTDDQEMIQQYQYDYVTKRVLPLTEIFPMMTTTVPNHSDQLTEQEEYESISISTTTAAGIEAEEEEIMKTEKDEKQKQEEKEKETQSKSQTATNNQEQEKGKSRYDKEKLVLIMTPTSLIRRNIVDINHPEYLPYRPPLTMLATIAKEILGILRVMDVEVAYGYAILNEFQHQQQFAEDCLFVRNYFHNLEVLTEANDGHVLTVHCIGRIIGNPPPNHDENSVDDKNSSAYFPNYHYDMRDHILEQLNEQDAHGEYREVEIAGDGEGPDYYIFLDIDQTTNHLFQLYYDHYRLDHIYNEHKWKAYRQGQTPGQEAMQGGEFSIDTLIAQSLPYYKGGWLVNSMKHLIFGGLFKHFGITFLHCTGNVPSSYSSFIGSSNTADSPLEDKVEVGVRFDGNTEREETEKADKESNRNSKAGDIEYTDIDHQLLYNLKHIVLHRTTLFALQGRGSMKESANVVIFMSDMAKEYNNFHLYEMFSTLDSVFCLDEELVVVPSSASSAQHRAFQAYPISMDSKRDSDKDGGQRLIRASSTSVFVKPTKAIELMMKKYITLANYQPIYSHQHLLSLIDTLYLKVMPSMEVSSLQFQRFRAMAFHNMKCEEIYKMKEKAFEKQRERQRQREGHGHERMQQKEEQEEEVLTFLDSNHWLERRICSNQHVFQAESLVSNQEFQVTGPRVAVITAIYGNRGYEKTLKRFAMQTVSTDFICFTDNPELTSSIDYQGKANDHGWIIDRTPYHLQSLQEDLDLNQTEYRNSLFRNRHPFNIAKFYKTSFHQIPRIRDGGYDAVIWIDGTIRITDHEMSSKILSIFAEHSEEVMIVFEHSRQGGLLKREVDASKLVPKYVNTEWLGIQQPFQDVVQQYEDYVKQYGYSDHYWLPYKKQRQEVKVMMIDYEQNTRQVITKEVIRPRPEYGVWCTCFIAFRMKKASSSSSLSSSSSSSNDEEKIPDKTKRFLETWYQHIKQYTTQDQISYSMVSQLLHIHPYSLPNEQDGIYGNLDFNSLYIKLEHGQ